MAIKDNVDFSSFSTPEEGFQLFGNSIRKGFEYNSYGDRTKFNAIVLSNPLPINPADLKYFTNSSDATPTKRTNKFVYRARIIGDNSPHQFLPDPCDITYAVDQQQALKVIAMHTLFVSNVEDGVGLSLPTINSVVEVELTKNVFGYNLQYGKHVKVVTNPDSDLGSDVDCDSLESIMESAVSAGFASSAADNKVYNDLSLLAPEFKALIDQLVARMRAKGHTPYVYETWRSQARQNYVYEQGRSGTINSGTHGQGMAVDFIDGRPHPDKPRLKVGWGSYESHEKKNGRVPSPGDIAATKMAKEFYDVLGREAQALGLEWGGTWKKLVDKPHVQAPYSMRAGAPNIKTYAQLTGQPSASDPTEGVEGSGPNAQYSSGKS